MEITEILSSVFIKEHSAELMILTLATLLLITLLVALPQLLRANMRKQSAEG